MPFWKNPKEKQADQFALDVLLPKIELLRACEDTEWDLCKLEIIFGVDREVIEKRIRKITMKSLGN